jgi:hypothetical protein
MLTKSETIVPSAIMFTWTTSMGYRPRHLHRPCPAAGMLTTVGAGDELFHTATGTAYADLQIDGHRETWPIPSKRFQSWLRRRYYQATGDAPSAAALTAALNLLEAQAQFEGPERMVHVRIAEHQGHIYLDLADTAWRAAEIGPDGWRVVAERNKSFCGAQPTQKLGWTERGRNGGRGGLYGFSRCSRRLVMAVWRGALGCAAVR